MLSGYSSQNVIAFTDAKMIRELRLFPAPERITTEMFKKHKHTAITEMAPEEQMKSALQ